MDWFVIIAFIITWLLGAFGFGKIIKELREALLASVWTSQEAADFMMAIATMLEDGKITKDELELLIKEYKEMVEAGAVAGKEWKDVLDAILEKIGK